ncbi:MAG: AAA family ATPase [Solirubrobacteraceae bacterium]
MVRTAPSATDPLASPAAYQMAAWTLRLAESGGFGWLLTADPHLFALLYATCAAAVEPPPGMLARDRVAATDVSEKLLPTLKDLQRQLGGETSGRFARLYLRGVSVYPAVEADEVTYRESLRDWRRTAEIKAAAVITAQERNVDRLALLLELDVLERRLLTFHLNVHRPGFSQLFDLLMDSDHAAEALLAAALGATPAAVLDALAEGSRLVRSGLLGVQRRPLRVSEPSIHLRATLAEEAGEDPELFARFLEPLHPSPSTASLARLDQRDGELLLAIARAPMPEDHGLHTLVYGPSSVDKRDMISRLVRDAELEPYAVITKKVPPSDLPAWVYIAQRQVEATSPGAVLVVDRADEVLASRRRGMLSLFFDDDEAPEDDAEERASDDGLIGSSVRCVWLTDRATQLSERNLGKFLFHCEALPGSRAARRERVSRVAADCGLSQRLEQRLARYSLLGEQQIRQAARLARVVAPPSGAGEREHVIERGITQAQRVLGRDVTEALRDSITRYDLDLLNIAGRFAPRQIVAALEKRPRASLLFWGIPGAGKTQLAEHIAIELDLPIMMRSASDLLSKWVGGTEQRLAKMFEEAGNEGALLFLDEADSFLRDRSLARAEWSVTQVNELLQKMERFEGVFVAATNLMDSIDAAAMRRFTWKLEFQSLRTEQAWSMFCTEVAFDATADPGRAAELERELSAIPDLTPGDFATVKRQAEMLRQRLTPEEWIEQLSVEAKAKMAGLRRQKLGFADRR